MLFDQINAFIVSNKSETQTWDTYGIWEKGKSLIIYNLREFKKITPKQYAAEKFRMQVELLKLQEDVIKNGRKIAIIFEGRDAAGKTATIQHFS